jgi:hypothetical protein
MSGSHAPPPGSIIRYAYLWADEHAAGRDEGHKDRPTLVLVVAVHTDHIAAGAARVLVLAVTHTPPRDELDAVPLPQAEKRRLGLDDIPAWIVTREGNSFVWPGPDIRPIPGRPTGARIYGQISAALLQRVARAYLKNRQRQRVRRVARSL